MKTNRRQFLKTSGLMAAGVSLVPASFGRTTGVSTAFPPSGLPNDIRLGPLKDLNGYFPFTPPTTLAEWEHRSEWVRRRLLVSLGLWPMPKRTPLNPVIHGGIERENYRVEKVFFESVPGFFVTGSLYRPIAPAGKTPGILFPHGHWKDGRLMEDDEDAVRRQIAQGAERFEEGARSIMQSLCVGLARLGCVVFHYDMIGYADSQQLSLELAHGFKAQRPEMNTAESWGLYSPQAEAHLQSVMGLQTWNSIRSLDFLLSLQDVDAERIACTGASGGGTQTFILGAIDDRVKLAFAAVMVSTAMQGGCTCENASLLRIDTGNVEIAGLIAARPLGMTTANDHTKEMATKGFPELTRLYTLLSAADQVALFRGEHFEHNYNAVSRVAFYGWLNRHFGLGLKEPILERDYCRLTREELTVWDVQYPAPAGGTDFERWLLQVLWDDASHQLQEAAREPEKFHRVHEPAVEIVLGRAFDSAGEVALIQLHKRVRGKWVEIAGRLRNETYCEELPVVICQPKAWNGRRVLWLTEMGKLGLFADGKYLAEVQSLLDSGAAVSGVDMLFQGEFLADGQPVQKTRRVTETREATGYTFGYNHALFAQRVHDVLTVLQFFHTGKQSAQHVAAVALDATTGPILAAALAVAGSALEAAAFDTHGFRFGQVQDLHDVKFLPGGAKYGDLPGLIALSQAGSLWIAGEPASTIELVSRLSPSRVARFQGTSNEAAKAAAMWLIGS